MVAFEEGIRRLARAAYSYHGGDSEKAPPASYYGAAEDWAWIIAKAGFYLEEVKLPPEMDQ